LEWLQEEKGRACRMLRKGGGGAEGGERGVLYRAEKRQVRKRKRIWLFFSFDEQRSGFSGRRGKKKGGAR